MLIDKDAVFAAAEKLVRCKGRYHAELNYKALAELFGVKTHDVDSQAVPDECIKCSDRLPEKDVDVQVFCADKKEQMVGYLEANEQEGFFKFATWKNGQGIYCQPSHWRPLPPAPEEPC